jgi:uncharacterized membrane protein YfcA
MDFGISAGSFFAGIVVGLTGMGGGALMMPMLMLGFGIPEVVAVSSDVIAATVMKPVGAAVHLKHGAVRKDLAKWLMVGSVPSALLSPWLLSVIHDLGYAKTLMRPIIGATLLIAALSVVAKALMGKGHAPRTSLPGVPVRVPATVLIGLFGGLVVGLTSVGSGSLMLVLLMWVYPRMSSNELVGTDLVQAVPLVLAAGIGHLMFGQVNWALTGSILLGTLPGIYLGARYSAQAKDSILRPIIASVLFALGVKLFGASNLVMAASALAALAVLATKQLRDKAKNPVAALSEQALAEPAAE